MEEVSGMGSRDGSTGTFSFRIHSFIHSFVADNKATVGVLQSYFLFLLVIVSSLPNGGLTTFGNLVYVSFGFSNLDVRLSIPLIRTLRHYPFQRDLGAHSLLTFSHDRQTLLEGTIPRNALSVIWFLAIGWLSLKRRNIRFWIMMASTVPLFVGLLGVGLLPEDSKYLWSKWGLYLMSVTGNINGLCKLTFLTFSLFSSFPLSKLHEPILFRFCSSDLDVRGFECCWTNQEVCR